MTEGKNVLLYWDDNDPPSSVRAVVRDWEQTCPTSRVALFSKGSAESFLRENFGQEISRMFMSCAIPAMRSDFFRVFWALSEGGLYSDLTFAPRNDPDFYKVDKRITVARWFHGRVVNGVFFARKDCPELKLVAYEILRNVSMKTHNSVWLATGPGAWIKALGQEETTTMAIIEFDDLFEKHLRRSGYESSTRDTDDHWSVREKTEKIFLDG